MIPSWDSFKSVLFKKEEHLNLRTFKMTNFFVAGSSVTRRTSPHSRNAPAQSTKCITQSMSMPLSRPKWLTSRAPSPGRRGQTGGCWRRSTWTGTRGWCCSRITRRAGCGKCPRSWPPPPWGACSPAPAARTQSRSPGSGIMWPRLRWDISRHYSDLRDSHEYIQKHVWSVRRADFNKVSSDVCLDSAHPTYFETIFVYSDVTQIWLVHCVCHYLTQFWSLLYHAWCWCVIFVQRAVSNLFLTLICYQGQQLYVKDQHIHVKCVSHKLGAY